MQTQLSLKCQDTRLNNIKFHSLCCTSILNQAQIRDSSNSLYSNSNSSSSTYRMWRSTPTHNSKSSEINRQHWKIASNHQHLLENTITVDNNILTKWSSKTNSFNLIRAMIGIHLIQQINNIFRTSRSTSSHSRLLCLTIIINHSSFSISKFLYHRSAVPRVALPSNNSLTPYNRILKCITRKAPKLFKLRRTLPVTRPAYLFSTSRATPIRLRVSVERLHRLNLSST